MAVGTSSEGTAEETGMKTVLEHLTVAWKMAESSDNVTTNPARRETEDETRKERVEATVAPMIESKPLVYCR